VSVATVVRRARTKVALLTVLSAAGATPVAEASRTQVTTGEMLGGANERRAFYISHDGGPWQQTYSGTGHTAAAQGALMNFRAANALFDDERRADDDPDANTDRFIAELDAYRRHGVLGFTVSLQGGNPGYEGALVSAFLRDGSLKDAWMQRTARLIEAADQRGMVVILTYFYQRQDQVLENSDAARRGVVNATDWLIANDYRNVVIEIANEHQHPGFDHGVIENNSSTHGIGELIRLARSRYSGRGYRQPVSSSIIGLKFEGALRSESDLALVHGNGTTPDVDANAVKSLVADNTVHGPVVMNEDHNGDEVTLRNLNNERATAAKVLDAGGSWGLMWRPYNQFYPFRWALGSGTDIDGDSMANYFHAVLDHIQRLTVIDGSETDPTPTPTPAPSPTPASGAVTGFTLIDAERDTPIAGFELLARDATVDLAQLPTRNLNLRANTSEATPGSVRFTHDLPLAERTENTPPFAAAGDTSGDYYAWRLEPGTYTVTATPYPDDNAQGAPGTAATLTLTVVDEP
jgi:hypothetical protein